MSEHHNHEPWVDTWFPLLVIIFGLIFVTFLTHFNPTT